MKLMDKIKKWFKPSDEYEGGMGPAPDGEAQDEEGMGVERGDQAREAGLGTKGMGGNQQNEAGMGLEREQEDREAGMGTDAQVAKGEYEEGMGTKT